MSTRRFEITKVPEPDRGHFPSQAAEIIPAFYIEHEIPPPPPLPASIALTTNHDTQRTPSKLFGTNSQKKPFDTRRRATIAAALASLGHQLKKSSSAGVLHQTNPATTSIAEVDESDVDSTIHSNNTNPLRVSNTFLQELRSKRRELRTKAKNNISIDQRIAFLRRENQRTILRAQDIFDVHFELEDKETNFAAMEFHLFTQESQEKIRKDIYQELDRQRTRQYHKHHRHLLLGRSLLVFMTLLLTFMSLTLIYVVSDLYDRAHFLDAILPENEFKSMAFDKTGSF